MEQIACPLRETLQRNVYSVVWLIVIDLQLTGDFWEIDYGAARYGSQR